jgi:hypothetical protein
MWLSAWCVGSTGSAPLQEAARTISIEAIRRLTAYSANAGFCSLLWGLHPCDSHALFPQDVAERVGGG